MIKKEISTLSEMINKYSCMDGHSDKHVPRRLSKKELNQFLLFMDEVYRIWKKKSPAKRVDEKLLMMKSERQKLFIKATGYHS